MSKIKEGFKDCVRVHGFFRLRITEDDKQSGKTKVVGQTPWFKNAVTNDGFDQYLVRLIGAMASSKQISHVALGTGGAPAATDTTLAGEITHASNSRQSVTTSSVSSKTQRFTATFSSANSFVTASVNISNIGLFQQSNTNTATLFAGNTYTSSALATNQNVNITYEIRFS